MAAPGRPVGVPHCPPAARVQGRALVGFIASTSVLAARMQAVQLAAETALGLPPQLSAATAAKAPPTAPEGPAANADGKGSEQGGSVKEASAAGEEPALAARAAAPPPSGGLKARLLAAYLGNPYLSTPLNWLLLASGLVVLANMLKVLLKEVPRFFRDTQYRREGEAVGRDDGTAAEC